MQEQKVRKDVLAVFIVFSLVVLSYAYDRIEQVIDKRGRVSSLERKTISLRNEIERFRRLKAEGEESFLTPQEYALFLERTTFGTCRFFSGTGKEKRDGELTYIDAEVKCFVPDFESAKKIIKRFRKYPISIYSYRFVKGNPSTFIVKVKVYGKQQ
jgi:hypothetical protein